MVLICLDIMGNIMHVGIASGNTYVRIMDGYGRPFGDAMPIAIKSAGSGAYVDAYGYVYARAYGSINYDIFNGKISCIGIDAIVYFNGFLSCVSGDSCSIRDGRLFSVGSTTVSSVPSYASSVSISRNPYGQLSMVAGLEVSHDSYGRICKLGYYAVSYNSDGKLSRIGG